MNHTLLIIIVILLAILIAVIAYNMHQESQYRRKIRDQFGHSDRDALMEGNTQSVRDGKLFGIDKLNIKPIIKSVQQTILPEKPQTADSGTPRPSDAGSETAPDAAPSTRSEPLFSNPFAEPAPTTATENHSDNGLVFTLSEPTAPVVITPDQQSEITFDPVGEPAPQRPSQRVLLDLNDLSRNKLPWFDLRFDYMAYVSLYSPQELHAIPRLSGNYHFQIIGCTLDGRFQVADPIPGVFYQAFVIGLQGINRKGLISEQELSLFDTQIEMFAAQMDGDYLLSERRSFLATARPLDELCARVDQTIPIHLVSRSNVPGTEIRDQLEQKGFRLQHDGSFSLCDEQGNTKFTIRTLNNTPFTKNQLASQSYQGFSMLFDIPRVAAGKHHFSEFIDIALSLSISLNLDLVDEQVQPLSSEWREDIRRYVAARQDEMLAVDIPPGSPLALRLFS